MRKDAAIAGDSETVTSGLNSRAYKPNNVAKIFLFGNYGLFYLIPGNDLLIYHLEFCTLSLVFLVESKSASML